MKEHSTSEEFSRIRGNLTAMHLATLILSIAQAALIVDEAFVKSITPEDVMDGKLPITDRRYSTFKIAMDIIKSRNLKVMVETGTSRKGDKNCVADGCATVLFSRWAEYIPGATFYSVDNNEAAVLESSLSTRQFNCTKVVLSDSVKFLREFPGTIDFLYLDTMDFDSNNPRPSQELPLKEIIAAYPKLHDDSVVMVDDCGLAFGGKCAYVELFLKELGWRTILRSYQLVMATQKPFSI